MLVERQELFDASREGGRRAGWEIEKALAGQRTPKCSCLFEGVGKGGPGSVNGFFDPSDVAAKGGADLDELFEMGAFAEPTIGAA